MKRLSERGYRLHMLVAIVLYVAAMLMVWPAVHTDIGLAVKASCALTPTLPVLYVIAIMARRIRDSDELEQRTHLLGLGAATAVVGVFSLIGGFLAAARILPIEGDVLIFVLPLLMLTYGVTHRLVRRHYGIEASCMPHEVVPWRWRLVIIAALLMVVGMALVFHHSDANVSFGIGVLAGIGCMAIAVLVKTIVRRRRHSAVDRGP